jgi:nitrate/nitrite transporter NarK
MDTAFEIIMMVILSLAGIALVVELVMFSILLWMDVQDQREKRRRRKRE